MKRILSSLIVLATILLTSCHKDELYPNNFKDGDAILKVNLSSLANSSLTRATQDPAEEQKINNAYIFIFNSGGGLVYSKFHTFSPNVDRVMTVNEEDVATGSNMTIAVVANLDNQIMDASESTFADVATLADLEGLSTLMLDIQHPLQRTSSFLMSGKKSGVTLSVKNTESIDVPLVRTDAKIKFNITVNGENYSNIEFTPTEWRVGSYPKRVKIFDTATEGEFTSADDSYGTYTDWSNFEQSSTTITASSTAPATFAFYGLENILEAGTIPQTGTIDEQYALREKQFKNANGTNQEAFEYAPDGSTFVEFKGAIWYSENTGGKESIADVTFKVQLGGVDKSGTDNVNNFNTYRNTEYTYNVSIKGVNDIDTEVETGTTENRPGAEGDIVVSETIKELDAYNSIFVTSFNKDIIDNNLRWEVSTIFSKGGKGSAKDYKWIHFRLNGKTENNYNDNFRTYPGDNSVYTDVLDATNDPSGVDSFIANYTNTDKLLDVDQLVEVLKRCEQRRMADNSDKTLYDGKNNITFTVFVKENYYDYSVNSSSTTFEPMLWQKFVNTDKRVLNIISAYKQSDDKESSRSEAQISFRQATIQTMYNTEESSTNFSGFGSQFYPRSIPSDPDAENQFTYGKGPYPSNKFSAENDKNNGRANCINFISEGDRWDKYINVATWTLKSTYDYPIFKFLIYNRDMDGDGVIDTNEIQWYMASINQLTDLWIGEDSFHPTSKLYLYTDWHKDKQHYVSSTVTNYGRYFKSYKMDILWASEGSSVGPSSDLGSRYMIFYRIVRNFGLANNSTAEVDKVYTYQLPTASADGWIELSRLNSKSIRNNLPVGAQLPNHELRDPAGNNKVPRKFAISGTIYGDNNYTWTTINAANSTINLKNNWRIPNQRELSLMYSVFPRNSTSWPKSNHFCRTGFCDEWEDDEGETRVGFSITTGADRLTLLNTYGDGGVRPVKDIQ